MTLHEITTRLREYIAENFLYMRQGFDFSDTDSLLENGIIDSMGVVELITFMQLEFAVDIDDTEITEENLGTLNAIARFIHGKRSEHLAA
jgi:acyl carrier protein